jgi:acyl-CoA synthetase (AMP-forming)/AMP-acid ligase II
LIEPAGEARPEADRGEAAPSETWSRAIASWRFTQRVAVASERGRWTGPQLIEQAASAGEWLEGIAGPPGLPLPLIAASSPEAVALVIAGAARGRPIAPLSPRMTARELATCVTRLAVGAVLADAAGADLARDVAGRTGTSLHVLPHWGVSRERLSIDADPDDLALLLHTSGTTGLPKVVRVTERALAARTRCHQLELQLGPGKMFAAFSPFHHIAGSGMLLAALGAGAAIVTPPRFSTEAWLQLREYEVTHVHLVPTMVSRLLEAGVIGELKLEVLQYGGAPMAPETIRAVRRALPQTRLVQHYGQTEGSPLTTLGDDDHRFAEAHQPALLTSVGRASTGVQLRIHDPDHEGVGELWGRAPHVFARDLDGWLHTADLASVDSRGFVFLRGRSSDKIVRGGENVYASEVERVLIGHPAILDVAVAGVPDKDLGERIKAYVVVRTRDRRPSGEQLRAFASTRLSGFKVPDVWCFVDEIPRTATGKIQRYALEDAVDCS